MEFYSAVRKKKTPWFTIDWEYYAKYNKPDKKKNTVWSHWTMESYKQKLMEKGGWKSDWWGLRRGDIEVLKGLRM